MWQEILMTDVTQMREGRVCIAGINHDGKVIRPHLPPPSIYERHLYKKRALLIYPRAVVKMHLTPDDNAIPPHIEDHYWENLNDTLYLRELDMPNFTQVLDRITYASIEAVFEADIHRNKNFHVGAPTRSLGTIRPISVDDFTFDAYPRKTGTYEYSYRLSFTDSTGQCFEGISITDFTFRYYVHYLRRDYDAYTLQHRMLASLQQVEQIWLRVGIGRDFQGWHWLQVNGIYTRPDYLYGKTIQDFKAMDINI